MTRKGFEQVMLAAGAATAKMRAIICQSGTSSD
ncbi:hypothetical protein SAMN05444161_8641 [Rhizobiales bacterium GAS191]|nr:hypothetical protein SAMN05444161_8641 [Rhizobiales bacterium GAS191]